MKADVAGDVQKNGFEACVLKTVNVIAFCSV